MKIENPHHFFYACNGYILENLDDLVVLLRDCDDGTFFYHANEHKNDFANWTRDIIQDNTLAKALFKKKSKKDMMKLVYDRVKKKKKNKTAVISELKGAMSHG